MRIARRTAAAALALALALGGACTASTSAQAVGPAADATDLTVTISGTDSFDPVWLTRAGFAYVQITNHGAAPVLVPGFNYEAPGTDPSDWLVNIGMACGLEMLAPGASCSEFLMYRPTKPWTGEASLTIAAGPTGYTTFTWPVAAKVDDIAPVMNVFPIPAFTGPFLPYAVAAGYHDHETDDGTEDVRVRLATPGAATLGDWIYPRAWQRGRWGEYGGWQAYGFGIGSLSPGVTECFSYRARDSVGNVAAWTAPRCTSAMWDDRRALTPVRGWTRGTGDVRYYDFGTWTRATARGSVLAGPVVTTKRIAVQATTCPTCGAVDVYVGTTQLGTLNLHGPMKHKALVMLPARATAVRGQVRLVVRTSGLPVIVDAIGTRVV